MKAPLARSSAPFPHHGPGGSLVEGEACRAASPSCPGRLFRWPFSPRAARRGFSLVEILVATSVLALMLTMVTTLLNSATQSTRTTGRRIETAADARLVFDRLAMDLAALVFDGQTTLIVGANSDPSANDTLAFLSSSRPPRLGSNVHPRLQALFYAVRENRDEQLDVKIPELVRGYREVNWDDLPAQAAANADAQITALAGETGDFSAQPSGSGVFRMAVCVHTADGDIYHAGSSALNPYALNYPSDLRLRGGSLALDLEKITALTVGLAVIDNTSRLLSADDLAQVARNLDEPDDGDLPLKKWNLEDATEGLTGGALASVRENLRFHQRTFTLPVTP